MLVLEIIELEDFLFFILEEFEGFFKIILSFLIDGLF